MKISTKSRYAVMAMMELAIREGQHSLNLSEISKIQGISISYLEQLFARLRQHGLVRGRRGPGGGYQLGRQAEEISISEIITAVNGNNPMQQGPVASEDENYVAAELWNDLSKKIYGYLNGISLAQCIENASSLIEQHDDVLKKSVG